MKFCYCPELPQNNSVQRAVSVKGKYWDQNKIINIYLDPTSESHKTNFIEALDEIFEHINLSYQLSSDKQFSDVRVSFKDGYGSWSYLGADALHIDKSKTTLNIGWSDSTKGTQRHEILHMLGVTHEHQNPDLGINWDKEQVYKDLQGAPNYWTKEQIDHNVLNALDPSTVNYTSFDPKSVMLYYFKDSWVIGGKGTKSNQELSETDISHIQSLYPKKEVNGDDFKTKIQKYCKALKYIPKGLLKIIAAQSKVDTTGTKKTIISRICK